MLSQMIAKNNGNPDLVCENAKFLSRLVVTSNLQSTKASNNNLEMLRSHTTGTPGTKNKSHIILLSQNI